MADESATIEVDESKLPTGVTRPEPFHYRDLVDVPPAFKVLRGGMLNVEDANWIIARAHDLGYWRVNDQDEPVHFVPHYGQARDEFIATHRIEHGIWTPERGDA